MQIIILKISRYLVLVLFLAYYSSISFFIHHHEVNGVTKVHSHPYNPFSEKGSSGHHHNNDDYSLITALSVFLTLFPFLARALSVAQTDRIVNKIRRINRSPESFSFFRIPGFRAPPVE